MAFPASIGKPGRSLRAHDLPQRRLAGRRLAGSNGLGVRIHALGHQCARMIRDALALATYVAIILASPWVIASLAKILMKG